MSGQIILTGNVVAAQYKEQITAMYRHNPYIEVLPRILDIEDIASRISRRPRFSEEERKLPPLHRIHAVQTISSFIEPLVGHIDLEMRFSKMIRDGYKARNPISTEWVKQVNEGFPSLDWGEGDDDYSPIIRSTSNGFAIIGASGTGKSTAIESVLGLYPQVIEHTSYNGQPFDRKQLVWLKLDCPKDGSIKSLCLYFFQTIDHIIKTDYYQRFKKNTADILIMEMANIAFNIGLGVLVIDEIQRLIDSKKNSQQEMMNFFVQLVNTIGVPVVTLGTFKAIHVLSSEFATARRAAGQGDMIWSNFANDTEWDDFIEAMWEYQWTDTPTPLTKKLKDALYDESCGIVDLAIKIYMLAQWNVIGEQNETISVGLIRKVAKENFNMARPILNALKTGDLGKLKTVPDVMPGLEDLNDFLKKAKEKVTIFGKDNTLKNQQTASKSVEANAIQSPFVHIAQWLCDAGIDKKVAINSAKKTIEIHGKDYDLKKAMQFAFSEAMKASNSSGTGKDSSNDLSSNKTKPLLNEEELEQVFKTDKEQSNIILDF